MKFMIYTRDRDNALDVRKANRDAHLAFLRESDAVRVISAGPWLSDDGIMAGSLLVVEAACLEDISNWNNDDPYVLAGLSAEVTIHPLGGWTDF